MAWIFSQLATTTLQYNYSRATHAHKKLHLRSDAECGGPARLPLLIWFTDSPLKPKKTVEAHLFLVHRRGIEL